ncbi:phage tail tape measure protein [Pseudomonas monteilii]|uniref:phage tail tape measure protein n=1 Tax=Pseudomonas monteilii TaxID=76759 RepID=UPI0015FE5121|nr:phage tail tape measure protein [Pseudomonas monteilii]MBA6103418.1 phage tail tape measure protein [Pseudomonas monteilii]
MANKLALALVIGGTVASSVGAAFKTVENGIQKLEAKGNRAKVLKSTIGETIKLREEWKRAHDSGAAGADKLLRKLNGNLEALRNQGVEVGRLKREYERLGREARAAGLQMKGHQQLQAGKESLKSNVGKAVAATAAVAAPTMISANYQAIIRDIAIKADIVNKPQEQQLTRTVIGTAADTGMARNDVAALVNQLVGAGMELDKALAYAPVAAKFAVGQGASGVDTASMIQALEQNAKISDPKVMQQALEAIAYQGQAGSFEASDMARWFPQLLAGMEKSGITGLDAVTSLGSMLQVQMKTAGGSDEAANNLKNWMEKIGSGEVVKAYKDAGIDYQASLNTGLQKGMNVIEASMALAMKYVEKTDPDKAKKIEAAKAQIDKEVDPEKARAALDALEKTLRTGDIFADMQVKAALTAYGQNRGLYEELKANSANAQKVGGILDKNLAERRETSAQQWAETVQAADDAMRSIGDAIRPATDMAAKGLTAVARGITSLSDTFPSVVTGIAGTVAAILALRTASSAFKIGKGVLNIARGRRLERSAGRVGRRGRAPVQLPKTGNKVLDTGLGVLGKVFGATASNDPASGVDSEPQRVFVVNADAIGRLGGSVANSAPAETGSRRARRRRRHRAGNSTIARRTPAAPLAKAHVPAAGVAALAGAAEANNLGRMVRSVRGITKAAGKLPGGKLIDAVPGVLDVALNAETQDEKAEGYGGVAGGTAGAMAGAAAGAAIGSIVPVIGTAVGGVVGAVLGGLGGESVGGWLGKRWFGEDAPEAEGKPQAAPGEVLRVTLEPQEAKPDASAVPEVGKPALEVGGTDNVTVPPPAPMPAVGDAVRSTGKPAEPVASPAPSAVLDAGRPALGGGGTDKVAMPPPAPMPAVGGAVRNAGKPAEPAARLVAEMSDEEIERRYDQLPAFAKRDMFEGVGGFSGTKAGLGEDFSPSLSLDAPPAQPKPAPMPVDAGQALGVALRELEKVPQVPATVAPTITRVMQRGQAEVQKVDQGSPLERTGLGDVVRDMAAKSLPAPPRMPELTEPAKAAASTPPSAPKVEQAFSFAPSIKIDVLGDVKDPSQVVREIEAPLRQLFEAWQREASARMASAQLFDQPHV